MSNINLQSLGITTETQYRCARGNMKSNGEYKGVVFTEEMIQRLDKQAHDRGWGSFTDNNDTPSLEGLDDLSIAEYYVRKAKEAKRRGIDFNLSLSDFKTLVKRKRCFYSNTLLTRDGSRTTFTIDRINNKQGYTKENSVPCAKFVNTMKNVLIEDDLSELKVDLKMLKRIVNKL